MRWLFLLISFINLYAIEHKSNISFKYITYNKDSNENTLSGDTKLKYEKDELSFYTTLEYLYSSEYDKRRYLDINELYLSYEYSDSNLNFGRQIKYWGELEAYNITDIFNKKRYINDPFDKDKKIGSYTLNNIFYLDDSTFELGVKFYEEDLEYPNSDDPYYPFALSYDKGLETEHSRYTPSIYAKYDFSNEEIESENSIIFWHGYDSKREMILDESVLRQEAYISSKFLYLANMIYGDYIFKFEGVATDVKSEVVSDYAQIALGGERGIYDIKGADLFIYLEYYKYKYFNKKQENIDISELYDDDLFLALKLNLNDTDDSELKAGILFDKNTSERVLKVELSTRIKDGLVFSSELLNIVAKDDSVLTPFDNSTRFSAGLTYTF
jgi:hypothetical protein